MMAEDDDATLNPDAAEALFEEVDETEDEDAVEEVETDDYDEFGNPRI